MKEGAKFSIIIPSRLSEFKYSAKDRETKFICAIETCLYQTFQDFEVIICSDNCEITEHIYKEKYSRDSRIRFFFCDFKGDVWARVSQLRNFGIEQAAGEYITYLDTDDFIGKNHLRILDNEVKQFDWIWYDELHVNKDFSAKLNRCELQFGKIGTCNITHKRELNVKWLGGNYKHDFEFLKELLRYRNFAKAAVPEYFICHQPKRFDV